MLSHFPWNLVRTYQANGRTALTANQVRSSTAKLPTTGYVPGKLSRADALAAAGRADAARRGRTARSRTLYAAIVRCVHDVGNELADYLTEVGDVDADKVAADVAAVLAERPGLRKQTPGYDPTQGFAVGPPAARLSRLSPICSRAPASPTDLERTRWSVTARAHNKPL